MFLSLFTYHLNREIILEHMVPFLVEVSIPQVLQESLNLEQVPTLRFFLLLNLPIDRPSFALSHVLVQIYLKTNTYYFLIFTPI